MTFDDVVGQEHVVKTLRHAIEAGRIANAYLFIGPRGIGKTTLSRIFAKALNCSSPNGVEPCGECLNCQEIAQGRSLDVTELDAASHNKVEDVKPIIESVQFKPASSRFKIYIIDECHMLSNAAWNALLKTLEEPPERVIFILATTELHKIPATILSRCQRFDFRRLHAADIAAHLAMIAREEGMDADDEALFRIAVLAQGGMRDAISMLELCAGGGRKIDVACVQETAGVSGFDLLYQTVKSVCEKDYETIFSIVSEMHRKSRDPAVFLQDLVGFYRDLLIIKTMKQPEKYLELSPKESELLRLIAGNMRRETILLHARLLDEAFRQLSIPGADKRLVLEMSLLRLCDERLSSDGDALVARIAALEDAVRGGVPVAASVQPPKEPNAEPIKPKASVKEEKTMPEAPKKTVERAKMPAREIPDFIEAVRALEQSDVSSASILKMAKASIADGEDTVVVTVDNDFYRMMLDKDSVKQNLVRVLGRLESLQGAPITGVVIAVGKKAQEKSAPDLDEFD